MDLRREDNVDVSLASGILPSAGRKELRRWPKKAGKQEERQSVRRKWQVRSDHRVSPKWDFCD